MIQIIAYIFVSFAFGFFSAFNGIDIPAAYGVFAAAAISIVLLYYLRLRPREVSRAAPAEDFLEEIPASEIVSPFFRNPVQFQLIAQLINRRFSKSTGERRVYNVLCFTPDEGEEAYSLSMLLNHHLSDEISWTILAGVANEDALKIARNGVYRFDDLNSVDLKYQESNWTRASGDLAEFVRAKESIRRHCDFQLLDLTENNWAEFGGKYDLIVCRGLFSEITDKAQYEKLKSFILGVLNPNGTIVCGFNEEWVFENQIERRFGPGLIQPKSSAPSTTNDLRSSSRPSKEYF